MSHIQITIPSNDPIIVLLLTPVYPNCECYIYKSEICSSFQHCVRLCICDEFNPISICTYHFNSKYVSKEKYKSNIQQQLWVHGLKRLRTSIYTDEIMSLGSN
jgi:hypothetical protein